MEEKQLDLWNAEKKQIEDSEDKKTKYKRRQFWLCKIGENIGSEISKNYPFVRPVLIINERLRWWLMIVLPLTTKFKQHAAQYYYQIPQAETYGLNGQSYWVLDQIKILSRKRLVRKLNDFETKEHILLPLLEERVFLEIVEKIRTLI